MQNTGTNNLAYVDVSATAYNSTGDFLASSVNNAFVYDLLPGQKAPFYIDLSAEAGLTGDLTWVPLATNITVAVTYAPNINASLYQGVSVTSSNHSIDANGLYTVTGVITNTGTQISGPLWVVATFYNASGTVVSVNFSNEVAETLAPGASVPFTVVPADNNVAISSAISNFSLLVQSQPLPTNTPTPTSAPTAPANPTPILSSTPSSTVNSPHTTIDNITVVIVALGIALAVVIVIVVLLLIKMRKKPNPPSTPQSSETRPIESPPHDI